MPRYIAKVALSILGDRIEKGGEFELSAEAAAHLDPRDVILASETSEDEIEAEAAAVPLEDMTHAQLKDYAKELGLKVSGSVADLRERIELHLASETSEDEIEEEDQEGDITSE